MKELQVIHVSGEGSIHNMSVKIDEKEVEIIQRNHDTLVSIMGAQYISFSCKANLLCGTKEIDSSAQLHLYRDGQSQVVCSTDFATYETEWL